MKTLGFFEVLSGNTDEFISISILDSTATVPIRYLCEGMTKFFTDFPYSTIKLFRRTGERASRIITVFHYHLPSSEGLSPFETLEGLSLLTLWGKWKPAYSIHLGMYFI